METGKTNNNTFNIKLLVNPPIGKICKLSLIDDEIKKHNKFFMIMLAIVKIKKLEIKVRKTSTIPNLINNNYNRATSTPSSIITTTTATATTTQTTPTPIKIISTKKMNFSNNNNNAKSGSTLMPIPEQKRLLLKRAKLDNRSISRTSTNTSITQTQQYFNSKRKPNASYHLKYDIVYGDHKLKISGKNDIGRLATDLKSINRLLNNGEDKFHTITNKKQQNIIKTKKNLYVLDLSTERETCLNFALLEIPIELFQMTQLKRLHLDCNHIKYIPDEFGLAMVNLEILTISNNRLKYLPMSLKNLTKLESIHLSRNRFDLFPFVLCQMPCVKFLDLSSNYLFDLPHEIDNMKQLESLLLFQNNLRTLPKSIGNLLNLRTLWLGSNQLMRLPNEICLLKNLDWTANNFDLSSNIANNPLVVPPMDVCIKGIESIREYFNEKEKTFYNEYEKESEEHFYQNPIGTIIEETSNE